MFKAFFNTATPGTLIHEYIHSLQSGNIHPVHGKLYKATRNKIYDQLVALMDEKIATIKKLEAEGKKKETAGPLKEFMLASQLLRNFGPWQDLIDERSIFLLYLNYGHEFGASKSDLELAKKNMGHLCHNEKLKKIMPAAQCQI